MLLALALLVLGTDVLERWGSDAESQIERGKAAGQLTAIGLVFVFVVGLIQSKYLFAFPEPTANTNGLVAYLLALGRNLQAGGPGGDPILGAFATDNLTMIARLTFVAAAFLTTLLALDYRPSGNPGEFYALILFSTAGMNFMASASELIMAYLSLELSSISLYILAGYFRNERTSAEAGIKYFLFGALSSGILLYGMSLAYGFTASVNRSGGGQPIIATLFSEIAKAGATSPNSALLTLAMIFVLAGIGYKVAVVPFHSWSPDVYQGAPTPITAFISTASKSAGFILLYRVLVTAFPSIAGSPSLSAFGGWTSLLAIIALVTVVFGNLSALPQKNAKRLLAYSSIGHAGFVLLAILVWSSSSQTDRTFGSASLIYYLIVYTVTNLGAFGALAVIREAVGGDDLSDLNGLWRRNISLALMLTVLVLSLAGVPPLSGFWAKFFVFMAGYQGGALLVVAVAVAMTIVSLYYYLGFLKAMWMNPAKSTEPVRTPRNMNVTLIAATVLVLLLGLFPNVVWNILSQATLVAGR
ncbi:MAG TPA: NADH-quinone oxidoreductase subunit N [Kouleothrix sp.]|uniref:NADH-quinone oxidoreductase subunit N n=1 Tax=Kouleothrix sp. TaxID=2779161 RepID=UPI002C83F7C7|nr:NADH-quinone oxidoreductase subunit N [Kouleothrix sp.]